ncbi:hypothetical protein [Piscibacillus salipiscarius]|uniref:Uncharacterized protein n=1 Tax=Piscibacillus salipiscarius TaxID=299480 RepID=A0ABW5QAV9_9BACI|nr:hypothetical protein [Piscibacillus salipiscarius]
MKKGIAIAIIIILPILFLLAPALVLFLGVVGLIILKVKFPAIKGAVGERYVNKELIKLGDQYHILCAE